MKVINLWGGPGSGKSTTAAGLFFVMKSLGHKVELVTEYAKELVYEREWEVLANQGHVFKVQAERLSRLKRSVDFAITDSPLPLSIHYASDGWRDAEFFEKVLGEYFSYENINYFINRVKPYAEWGRHLNEAGARQADHDLRVLANRMGLTYRTIDGDRRAPNAIYQHLERKKVL